MKAGICSVAVLMGAMGIVTNSAAVPESNSTTLDQSSLTPLISRVVAQANQAQPGDVTTTRTMGVCYPVPNIPDTPPSAANTLSPILNAWDYFNLYEHKNLGTAPATVTVLQSTKQGVLTDGGDGNYLYIPDNGYFGKDKAIFLIDFGDGHKVQVKYYFQVVDGFPGNESMEEYCGKTGHYWKISSTLDPNGNSTITSVEYQSPIIDAGATTTDTAALASTLGASLPSELKGPGSN